MSMDDAFVIGGLASASTPPSTSLVVDVLTDKNSAAKDLGVLNISSGPPNSFAPTTAPSSWWSAVPTVRCTRLPESAPSSQASDFTGQARPMKLAVPSKSCAPCLSTCVSEQQQELSEHGVAATLIDTAVS